jgi:fatty acid desaturase
MVLSAPAYGPVADTSLIGPDGRPAPAFRSDLRRIPSVRNALSVLGIYLQAILVIAVAMRLNNVVVYALAILLMGRTHAQCLGLMHESVHRLLMRNKAVNDFFGRWLLGYPAFTNTDGYRIVHMAHHREEFGPNEPDIPLYANYPITNASFWRKMRRDALFVTGLKMLRGQIIGLFRGIPLVRHTNAKIFAVQAALVVAFWYFVAPWGYVVFWLVPYLTVWRVMNRLRSIAEHGGLRADDDRRITTHSVRQSRLASFLFVPFNLGWHIAHHTDSGIPFRSLPKYHAALRTSGFVTNDYEYPNYRSLWRALRAG